MMKPKQIILFFIISSVGCVEPDKSKMLGDDIRLFQGTQAWDLAKAVDNDDVVKIHDLVKKDRTLISYREPRFGQTLLIWSVYTNHYKSVKALLEEGSDPNLPETYSRKSAIMYASDYGPNFDKSPDLLKLCLKYKGDPNAAAIGETPEGYKPRMTPLMISSACCLAKTQILVNAGADINYLNEKNETALLAAVSLGGNEQATTTRYLLLDKHANFRKAFVITINKDTTSFAGLLRHWVYPLDSKEYRIKMEIVQYLKSHGQDYWATPIPHHYFKNYSKEYLSKY